MTNSYSSSGQDLLCKQYTFDTLRVGHPTGVALSWFGFPLLYPLFPPLRGSWGLIGYTLCRYGITCMCPRPAGKGTCFLGNRIDFRTGDTFGIFSHQRFPFQSMASPFCRLFVFLVVTSSDCHLRPCFLILTNTIIKKILLIGFVAKEGTLLTGNREGKRYY